MGQSFVTCFLVFIQRTCTRFTRETHQFHSLELRRIYHNERTLNKNKLMTNNKTIVSLIMILQNLIDVVLFTTIPHFKV